MRTIKDYLWIITILALEIVTALLASWYLFNKIIDPVGLITLVLMAITGTGTGYLLGKYTSINQQPAMKVGFVVGILLGVVIIAWMGLLPLWTASVALLVKLAK